MDGSSKHLDCFKRIVANILKCTQKCHSRFTLFQCVFWSCVLSLCLITVPWNWYFVSSQAGSCTDGQRWVDMLLLSQLLLHDQVNTAPWWMLFQIHLVHGRFLSEFSNLFKNIKYTIHKENDLNTHHLIVLVFFIY